mgnify:CR=1 FL=1
MTIPVIKAITKRIRLRYGSTEAAATAAGVSPGVWSGYENADKPETTIPLGRLVDMSLTADERKAIAGLFAAADDDDVTDILDEAAEATEAVANVQRMVRLAAKDGERIKENDARPIRAAVLDAKAELDDVLQGLG